MTTRTFSPLSRAQWNLLKNSTARINIAHGPVRSGKNFVENIRFSQYLVGETGKSDIAFCGASKKAVYRIFLRDLFELIGDANYTYNRADGSGKIFGRDFYTFGFTNANDYQSLRGTTLGGALMTEGTLCHEDFFNELLARLSVTGSKLFIDTNPAGPYHWLYEKYLNNAELIKQGMVRDFPFTFDSNLSLSDEYKESLKQYYGPGTLWYRRMIQGEWCMADGIIYDMFSEANTVKDAPLCDRYCIAVDYGTSNPCVFVLIGKSGDELYAVDSYYYDGRARGQKTNLQYADDLATFINEQRNDVKQRLKCVIVDPSAASFKTEIRSHHGIKLTVKDANNDVLEGIETVSKHFYNKTLFISHKCEEGLREIPQYIWDKNAQKRGEDKPVKASDHFLDALRYGVMTPWGGGFSKNWGNFKQNFL